MQVDKTFPFDQLGPALEHLASGTARGRVVLQRR
ncbi:MAG: zinc-binding dehydrogenase [Myxococcaceae bacterium]|nr:zinc-binding dehydrogenase [Myxococcaceae bacterium]